MIRALERTQAGLDEDWEVGRAESAYLAPTHQVVATSIILIFMAGTLMAGDAEILLQNNLPYLSSLF